MAASSKSKTTSSRDRLQVKKYLAAQPAATRRRLNQMRAIVREAAPDAAEHISYGILAYKLGGQRFVYFSGWKAHTSVHPMTPAMTRALAPDKDRYKTSKGTVQFPLDKPLPVTLVRRLIKARIAEMRQ